MSFAVELKDISLTDLHGQTIAECPVITKCKSTYMCKINRINSGNEYTSYCVYHLCLVVWNHRVTCVQVQSTTVSLVYKYITDLENINF